MTKKKAQKEPRQTDKPGGNRDENKRQHSGTKGTPKPHEKEGGQLVQGRRGLTGNGVYARARMTRG